MHIPDGASEEHRVPWDDGHMTRDLMWGAGGQYSCYGLVTVYIPEGASEEHRVLGDDGKATTNLNQGEVGNIHTIYHDSPFQYKRTEFEL